MLQPVEDGASLGARLEMPELVHLVYRPLTQLERLYPARVGTLLRVLLSQLEDGEFHRVAAVVRDALTAGAPPDDVELEIAISDDWMSKIRARANG